MTHPAPVVLSGDETEFFGRCGWAKQIRLDSNAIEQFDISSWLLYAPHAHPLWAFHLLSSVHLRTIPNAPAPVLRFPEATHEILVVALNPEHQPYSIDWVQQQADSDSGLPFLTPPDVSEQLTCSDDEVRKLTAYAAWACCHGHLLPDSDDRIGWSQSLKATLKHLRGEEH